MPEELKHETKINDNQDLMLEENCPLLLLNIFNTVEIFSTILYIFLVEIVIIKTEFFFILHVKCRSFSRLYCKEFL